MMDKKKKSSADWNAEAEALRKRLDTARREARRMRKLEEYKAAEIRRQEEIRYALQFLQVSKSITINASGMTAYDVIDRKMAEMKSEGHFSTAGE